jgi:hypothetical protein
MKRIAPVIVLTALLIGLPLLGAISTGHPISLYLEFPPHTQHIQHAPFSRPAFTFVGAGALLAGAVFIFLYLPRRPETYPITARQKLPRGGWLSGICILASGYWHGSGLRGLNPFKISRLHPYGYPTWFS